MDVALAVAVVGVFRRFGAGWAVAAFALGVLLWLGKLALLYRVGLDHFGLVHVLWLDLVVAVPVAGVALLVRRGRHPVTRVVGALALVPAALGVYASFVEPARLVVERSEVPVAARRAGHAPVRVGVISDLQFSRVGDHERRAVARLNAQRPDLVLMPGDIHQGSDEEFRDQLPEIRRLLSQLRAPTGVYFAPGDQERGDEARQVLRGTGIRLLSDRTTSVGVHDRRIALLGLELRPGAAGGRRALRRFRPPPGDIRLVVAHRPDWVGRVRGADLLVSGHTHGGQVQLPYAGPPTIASRVPRGVGAGGLHRLGGQLLYVSRGVGVERGQAPKLRIGDPPEVSLITLR